MKLTGFSVLFTLTTLEESSSFLRGHDAERLRLGTSGDTSSCESSLKSALVGFSKTTVFDY